jgi:metal-sulfur cluster biosynthetic enzyme
MPERPLEQLEAIASALRDVVDPCSIATGVPVNLPDMGLVKDVRVSDGSVQIILRVTSPLCMQVGNIVDAVESRLSRIPGITSVVCTIDASADWTPALMASSVRRRRLIA